MKVVSTGGLAPVFEDELDRVSTRSMPDITARGLIEICKRSNRE